MILMIMFMIPDSMERSFYVIWWLHAAPLFIYDDQAFVQRSEGPTCMWEAEPVAILIWSRSSYQCRCRQSSEWIFHRIHVHCNVQIFMQIQINDMLISILFMSKYANYLASTINPLLVEYVYAITAISKPNSWHKEVRLLCYLNKQIIRYWGIEMIITEIQN